MLKTCFGKEELGYFSSSDDTPLCEASVQGHLEIIKYLIDKRADVNAKDIVRLRRKGLLRIS